MPKPRKKMPRCPPPEAPGRVHGVLSNPAGWNASTTSTPDAERHREPRRPNQEPDAPADIEPRACLSPKASASGPTQTTAAGVARPSRAAPPGPGNRTSRPGDQRETTTPTSTRPVHREGPRTHQRSCRVGGTCLCAHPSATATRAQPARSRDRCHRFLRPPRQTGRRGAPPRPARPMPVRRPREPSGNLPSGYRATPATPEPANAPPRRNADRAGRPACTSAINATAVHRLGDYVVRPSTTSSTAVSAGGAPPRRHRAAG